MQDRPNQYTISTFAATDFPLPLNDRDETRLGRSDSPILAVPSSELLVRSHGPAAKTPDGKAALIELNKRLSYPTACLVLMLVGVPLGMATRRGGKSAGFVLTILLVFVYYFLSIIGVALARQGKLPPFAGVWLANVAFGIGGIVLLRQMVTGGAAPAFLGAAAGWVKSRLPKLEAPAKPTRVIEPVRHHARGRFPLILDDYILREFLTTLGLVLVTFVMLLLVFTFFELIGDIIRNKTPFITVGDYLINLTPSMIYTITPLSVLLAVLVTFGALQRNNELTAMKATGISLYRVALPVLVIAFILAASLFAFDETYVPTANRRQEALRSVIKGKPAQTFFRPDQKWMFGSQQTGKPDRIFYYQFFDPDHDRFANVTIFEMDPATFTLSRRIFATTARWEPQVQQWIFENGWVRYFQGRRGRQLPALCSQYLPGNPRASAILQEGKLAVAGDELHPVEPLHSRSQPKRLRHDAIARAAERQAGISAHHAGNGGAGDSLRAVNGPARLAHRHRRSDRSRRRLLGHRGNLPGYGQREYAARHPRGMVARCIVWPCWKLSIIEDPHLTGAKLWAEKQQCNVNGRKRPVSARCSSRAMS